MEYLRPSTWNDAVAMKTEHPSAVPINGGTDLMVEINFARRRPEALLDLSRLGELKEWKKLNGEVELGAGVTYTRIIEELSAELPALAAASRTVGSPQIRNRGTAGGNLATASPAGDAHPPLLASGASVRAESMRGVRDIPVSGFFTGPKRHCLEPDELIRSVIVPAARGPQQFSKAGARNAMVIAVVSFALALDLRGRKVGTGIGAAAPTPVQAAEAQAYLEQELETGGYWDDRRPLAPGIEERFGDLAASAASPIDDVRGAARYRIHALRIMAGRTLGWAWEEACRAGKGGGGAG